MQTSPFEQIFTQAYDLLSNYQPKDNSLQKYLQTHTLMQRLTTLQEKQLNLPQLQDLPQGIYTRTLIQKDEIRLSLYYMTAGQSMALHNHPGMIVISYVLRGNITAKYYTQLKSTEMLFRKQEIILQKGSVSWIDGLRSKQRNLHELKANQNSLFLDIITPEYNQTSRICRYFQEDQQIDDNLNKLIEAEDNMMVYDL